MHPIAHWAEIGLILLTLGTFAFIITHVLLDIYADIRDRLFRKGLLVRERDGRRFRYRPRWSRDELDLHLAGVAMATWLADDPRTLRPLVSLFVDEVTRRDESMLDELERLIRQKKGGDR